MRQRQVLDAPGIAASGLWIATGYKHKVFSLWDDGIHLIYYTDNNYLFMRYEAPNIHWLKEPTQKETHHG